MLIVVAACLMMRFPSTLASVVDTRSGPSSYPLNDFDAMVSIDSMTEVSPPWGMHQTAAFVSFVMSSPSLFFPRHFVGSWARQLAVSVRASRQTAAVKPTEQRFDSSAARRCQSIIRIRNGPCPRGLPHRGFRELWPN